MPAARDALTIGALATAAGVGVETVRYYQRLGLLAVPQAAGGFRRYGSIELSRLRFIRRAQSLGFTLVEIGELLQLQDGTDRRSVRRIAQARLAQLQSRIIDMQKMAHTLRLLIDECEHGSRSLRCPIIASIESSTMPGPAGGHCAAP
jgi:MerR family mercuric resistance operon transcriptional regulator